jgi:hypothetical protein
VQFLNPALLFGALLFAVPLLIHLLNRQRHKTRPWAAMEFLLRAYQKTRNRLRNENLLLLLLRCLIPILLALAIARPVLQNAIGPLGQNGSVHHVVVLDASYSMGYQTGSGQSPFDKGRMMVSRLLEQLGSSNERGDRVTLVSAGVRPKFLVTNEANLALAKAQWLDVVKPEDGATDLTAAVAQVVASLREAAPGQTQVYLITDLQTRAFGKSFDDPKDDKNAAPQFQDTLRDLIEVLKKLVGTQVHLIDTGPLAALRTGGLCDNVQVTGIHLDQPLALARVPITAVATLRNRGAASASVMATLEVDGGEPVRKVVTVSPGAEVEAEFPITFRETGRRRIRVSVQNDNLEADDAFDMTLDVRERIRILLVDGAADDDPLRAYRALYQAILDPTGGKGSPLVTQFEVTVRDNLALLSGQDSPMSYDVTVLADVDRLNERAANEIQKALQAGKGLLCAFGDRVEANNYNLQLHKVGTGPMPFRLATKTGGLQGSSVPRAPVLTKPEHPLLREFDEDIYREIAQSIPVYQWFATEPDSFAANTEIVMRLTDRDQSPLLIAAPFGEGRCAFLLSAPAPADKKERWNRFDDPMIAFHLLHGLIKWLALPAQDPFNVVVGTQLSCSLPARPTDVEVLVPERLGGGKQPIAENSRALPFGRFALPPFANTVMSGIYVIDLQLDREAGKENWSQPFAVHVDPEEGQLSYRAHDEVRQVLGLQAILSDLPATLTAAADSKKSELGPTLLLALLLLVLGEAAMARFVSVRRT